jgi:hypothetical protein
MPFIVIHGEDQVKARAFLEQTIDAYKSQGGQDIVTLDGKTLTQETLTQNLESNSFFGDQNRLTVIENLHRQKSKTNLKKLLEYLNSFAPQDLHLILYEDQDLTPAQAKKLSGATIHPFKLSPTIFALTDSINPSVSPKLRIIAFNNALKDNPSEMILILLARQLRLLIQTFDPSAVWPPHLSWQKTKLTPIAKRFGQTKLISLHHKLTQIDLDSKTGVEPGTLESRLKIWISQF